MKTLQDRVAVITGAGSGIGRATALALAKEGCDLALSDINEAGLAETQSLLADSGRKVCTHRVNVAVRKEMEAYPEQVLAAHGRVHIVVNNAGVASGANFEDQSLDAFERVLAVNLYGVIYGSKVFIPHLKAAGEGHIVNISSILGLMPAPALSAYCTSKFAVRGFSQCLWLELREHNIGVTAIHPGNIKTNITASAAVEEIGAMRGFFDEFKKAMEEKGAEPGTVAKAIVKSIKGNRQRTLVTAETVVMDQLMRWMPTGTPGVIARVVKAGKKRMAAG
jgi:NAD(P)-dependent dehydrogenase (short-subunit alcohol dehydrogenase family)